MQKGIQQKIIDFILELEKHTRWVHFVQELT